MTMQNLPLASVWRQENPEDLPSGGLALKLTNKLASWRLDMWTGAISKLWRGRVEEWLSSGTVSPGCISVTDESKIKQSSNWSTKRRRPLNLMAQSNTIRFTACVTTAALLYTIITTFTQRLSNTSECSRP